MASPLNPGTFKKRDGKRYESMVLIASAEARLRQKWALGLQNAFVIHEVSKRVELESAMTNFQPAVLLLDSDLPQLGKVKGVPALQRLSPSTKIVVFGSIDDEKEAISAFKAGAKAYCNKDIDLSLLRKAVTVVQKGEVWVGRKTVSQLLAELTSIHESREKDCPALSEVYLKSLTPREKQITLLIGKGACNKEIASALNVSERTIKAHLSAVFQKLQIPDRLHLGLFVNSHNH